MKHKHIQNIKENVCIIPFRYANNEIELDKREGPRKEIIDKVQI